MIDLHCHTTASDGTDTPESLIDRAVSLHLSGLAITDHDTLKAYETATAYAEGKPLRLITGVELSARVLDEPDPSYRSAHVLGYFPCGVRDDFRVWLDTLRTQRKARNAAVADRLQQLGMDIRLEEAEDLGRNITGRPHFARLLIDKGYCRSMEEAFRLYLGETGAAYVEREDPAAEGAMERIRLAGGLPVLAHPTRCIPPHADARAMIGRWRTAGLAGVEVWHPDHGERERSWLSGLAREFSLIVTGGSDYHGEHKPEIRLGHGRHGEARTPNSVLEQFDRFAERA